MHRLRNSLFFKVRFGHSKLVWSINHGSRPMITWPPGPGAVKNSIYQFWAHWKKHEWLRTDSHLDLKYYRLQIILRLDFAVSSFKVVFQSLHILSAETRTRPLRKLWKLFLWNTMKRFSYLEGSPPKPHIRSTFSIKNNDWDPNSCIISKSRWKHILLHSVLLICWKEDSTGPQWCHH